jgi:nitroreductase
MSAQFDALQSRRSTRRFLEKPVEKATLERILVSARRAPSGANLQPGFVHLLTGDPLASLSERLCVAFEQSDARPEEYDYFPQPMPAYLKARQREVGYALYNSLGIARRDIPGRLAQHRRNFQFFDAPVGLVITIERAMGKGCYMDLGLFIQSIFLAARAEGVDSCGIGALASYHHIIRDQLAIPDNEVIVCGMALGYGDPSAPENQFETPRAPLEEYARFLGF